MTHGPAHAAGLSLTYDEKNLLGNVDRCLAQGVAIMDWWRQADARNDFQQRFELTHVYNRPDSGYSFFDTVPMPAGPLPVMGDVPLVFYDQPKARAYDPSNASDLECWNREVREFALRYFMRVSDFRLPQVVEETRPGTFQGPLRRLGWCPRGFERREGFGFQQLYYKLRSTGEIGRFPEAERFAIVDAEALRTTYEWVVADVRIFNFELAYPVDPDLPKVSLPLPESQYIILSDAFVFDESAGRRGRYQFGYAMLRPLHDHSVLAYGPGQFDAGFQLFTFTVEQSGEVWVRMPFVVNRPTKILDISLDPLDWALTTASALSGGRTDPLLEPIHAALDRLPWRPGGFDPVFTGIDLLNLFTLGQASRRLCISKEQLEKIFLIFHFDQYYTMITGSLLTWRQIRDWLDTASLPAWVRTGRSS